MIVITTPTGQIGRQVLGNLLDSGQELRVIARDPSQLPAEVREDLDIVEGSWRRGGCGQGICRRRCRFLAAAGGPTGAFGRSSLRRLHPARHSAAPPPQAVIECRSAGLA